MPAFSRIASRRGIDVESTKAAEKPHAILSPPLFETKLHAKGLGRIISSQTLQPMRKDVTGYLYGGDITRKMKLWEKQKKGKKRLKEHGKVNIPNEVFLKMLRQNNE